MTERRILLLTALGLAATAVVLRRRTAVPMAEPIHARLQSFAGTPLGTIHWDLDEKPIDPSGPVGGWRRI